MTIHSKISLDGKDYIILPLADYDALRAAAEEAEDEAAGVEAMAARDDAKARGEYISMPESEWAHIEAGESPVRVVRLFRGLTQTELSEKSGIRRPEISAIEAGTRRGTVDTLKALAKALGVPLDVIAGA